MALLAYFLAQDAVAAVEDHDEAVEHNGGQIALCNQRTVSSVFRKLFAGLADNQVP